MITAFLQDVRERAPGTIAGQPVTDVRDKDGVKYVFGDRGWLLHRLSGTEPMIRLYCEHEDEAAVEKLSDAARARLGDFAAEEERRRGA